MNTQSVRFRVTVWYGSMFAMALALFGALAFEGFEQYLDRILRNTLRYDARTIAETVLEAGDSAYFSGRRMDFLVQSEIERRPFNSRFIRIRRADGSLVYLSNPPADHSFDPQKIRPAFGAGEFSRDELHAGSRPVMVYTFPYVSTNGSRFIVETGNTYVRTRQTLHDLAWVFAGIGLVATLLAGLGGWFAIGRAMQPVRAITREADRISWQERHERLPVPPTGDELEQLSRTLNSMLDRLEDALDRIHRFSADVSHELRTPLTIIRGELESIVRQVPCPPQVLDGVGSSLEEVDRLARIVDHLLVLCRLDSGDDAAARKLIDLGNLASDTAEQMRLLFVDKDLQLSPHLSSGVMVLGAPVRLRQVIVNLLDNAIKYSNSGGRIELTVGGSGDRAYLEVADTGIGIPPEALPHLFERFYRTDKARSRVSGGAGLGLAIVRAIAVSHGGEVHVESVEGSGTRIRLELPGATTADSENVTPPEPAPAQRS